MCITAAVDQLLHTEVLVAYLLSASDILLPLLISCYTKKSRLHTCYPHHAYHCRCWSVITHIRVDCPPIIHIRYITAPVDQLLHTEVKVAHLLSTSDRLLPLLITCWTQKSRLTYYCHCLSADAHRRVGCPPVIHIRHVTAAVDQLLYTNRKHYCDCWSADAHKIVGCPTVIQIGYVTAAVHESDTILRQFTGNVDQLLHSEEYVAHLLSTSDRLLALLIIG